MTPSLMVFEYHPPTISIISILITNLLCLLPTTLNHNLPETFEEAAAIQDKVNMFIEQRRKRSSKAGFINSHTLNPDSRPWIQPSNGVSHVIEVSEPVKGYSHNTYRQLNHNWTKFEIHHVTCKWTWSNKTSVHSIFIQLMIVSAIFFADWRPFSIEFIIITDFKFESIYTRASLIKTAY